MDKYEKFYDCINDLFKDLREDPVVKSWAAEYKGIFKRIEPTFDEHFREFTESIDMTLVIQPRCYDREEKEDGKDSL